MGLSEEPKRRNSRPFRCVGSGSPRIGERGRPNSDGSRMALSASKPRKLLNSAAPGQQNDEHRVDLVPARLDSWLVRNMIGTRDPFCGLNSGRRPNIPQTPALPRAGSMGRLGYPTARPRSRSNQTGGADPRRSRFPFKPRAQPFDGRARPLRPGSADARARLHSFLGTGDSVGGQSAVAPGNSRRAVSPVRVS